jgi:cullin-4
MQRTAPRKLVIQPLKDKPRVAADLYVATWNKLAEAMSAIRTHSATHFSLEELYQGVRDICVEHKAATLFAQFESEFASLVAEHKDAVRRVLSECDSSLQGQARLVSAVVHEWQDFVTQLSTIRNIFLEMECDYVKRETPHRSLWVYGLHKFRDALVLDDAILSRTIDASVVLINAERSGEALPSGSQPIENVVRMLLDLQVYAAHMGPALTRRTREFYASEASRWLSQGEVPQYLLHVEKRLSEENTRATRYADHATAKEIVRILESEFIGLHIAQILERGFSVLMAESAQRISDLARLYSLLKRHADGMGLLKKSFSEFIKSKGSSIVENLENDKENRMVSLLLELTSQCDKVIKEAFNGDTQFTYAMQEALSSSVNRRQNKPAELMARYLDGKLKSGNKEATEEELEAICDRVLVLFRCVQAKDMFEAYYKNDLAKRLLLGRSASADAEKMMLAKLKAECGAAFTSRLEGMFKDMELSKDLMASFKDSKHAQRIKGLDFTVSVLSMGNWPNQTTTEGLRLTSDMVHCQSVFTAFYADLHNDNRRITWQHTYSTCHLKAFFPKGTKELVVSLQQALVLLLFNNGGEWSYARIRAETGLEERDLKQVLTSMALDKKQRVLVRKEKEAKEVGENDVFTVNDEFTSPSVRVKINSVQMKETVEETEQTREKVMEDRQYQIDAAVVRVMKARRKIELKDLISEVFSQLRFELKAADLKKRIESLIERDYMERDHEQPSILHYIA